MSILIVGASVAGVRTAQSLRLNGYGGEITLLGDELHHPYDKPPLSKEMLARGTSGPVALLTTDELAALDVDLRLGARAVRLDPVSRVVETADGARVDYLTLVIATGVQPRTLPGAAELGGVHTLRTADDAASVRAALHEAHQVVVIGAGFIGAEFASAARSEDVPVTMLEALPVPMSHVLGPQVGAMLGLLHERHGVEVVTGVTFDRFEGEQSVTAVVLADGRSFPADLVVVGIGARPATEWLASSGLPITDGVECDEQLRVVGFPDIHAVGDVARWPHPLYSSPVRIEHWTNANEHAGVVAASILGTPPPRAQVPYVWSDQYGHRIQIVGRPSEGALAWLQGDVEDGLQAVYEDAESRIVGALVVDDPRSMMKFRKAILKHSTLNDLGLGSKSVSAPA
jgi:NADPH-dependent 2,4-dienoyl-CoA reductase/sulfur reductase-like enzyme